MGCLFCKIIKKSIPSEIVLEDGKFICFKDINPKAPIHLLIVPKKHLSSLERLRKEHKWLAGEMMLFAKKAAAKQGVSKKGYKLVLNVGKGAGQAIGHLHLHLLSGWEKGSKIPALKI